MSKTSFTEKHRCSYFTMIFDCDCAASRWFNQRTEIMVCELPVFKAADQTGHRPQSPRLIPAHKGGPRLNQRDCAIEVQEY